MAKRWVIGAQLSTSHSSAAALTAARAAAALRSARAALDLDILVVGADEVPAVFGEMTEPARRQVGDVYLWYNLLSDIAGMEASDLVVDWRGRPSRGWGGWSEHGNDVRETFRFVCPNNPDARRKTLSRLAELLGRYPFDGVFLDKIRFPSPANGIDEVVSCFCPHCHQAAASRGLDLSAVARMFERRDFAAQIRPEPALPDAASPWLESLLEPKSLLARFVRFRCESVTGIIAAAHEVATAQNRKVALDLFSPGLATVVGQDYRALRPYAVWAKPMTYRVALGPASLRLEVPSLADGLARLLGVPEPALADWASHHFPASGPRPWTPPAPAPCRCR